MRHSRTHQPKIKWQCPIYYKFVSSKSFLREHILILTGMRLDHTIYYSSVVMIDELKSISRKVRSRTSALHVLKTFTIQQTYRKHLNHHGFKSFSIYVNQDVKSFNLSWYDDDLFKPGGLMHLENFLTRNATKTKIIRTRTMTKFFYVCN